MSHDLAYSYLPPTTWEEVESSMIAAADPNNAGLNMEMDAILSVALGGTLLSGGKFYIAAPSSAPSPSRR